MNIQMICTDLDRTLLKNADEISDFTMQTIRDAIRAGVLFVPVTGRPLQAIPVQLMTEPGIRYHISSNGAVVYDREEDRVMRHAVLSYAQVRDMFGRLSGYDTWRELCISGISYVDASYYENAEAYAQDAETLEYLRRTRRPVPDLMAFAKERESRIEGVAWFTADPPVITAMAEEFGVMEGVSTVISTPYTFEAGHEDATKGRAMLWLAARLGIDPACVMGCGDAANDMDLVRLSGLGVAVANASPDLLAKADRIAGHHADDGIAVMIREVLGL